MNQNEVWKDVKNYEGIYQVSNLGRVKSLKRNVNHASGGKIVVRERIRVLTDDGYGYLQLNLLRDGKRKCRKVHQLVSESFLNHHPNGYSDVVNHINQDRVDNNVLNLEIVSFRENTNKKHIKGSSKYTGVCFHKSAKKWTSSIFIKGKHNHLGLFDSEIEASNAYQTALKEII